MESEIKKLKEAIGTLFVELQDAKKELDKKEKDSMYWFRKWEEKNDDFKALQSQYEILEAENIELKADKEADSDDD